MLRTLLTWFAVGAIVVVPIFLIQVRPLGPLSASGWAFIASAALLVPLRLCYSALGYRRAAKIFCALLFAIATYNLFTRGVTPAAVLSEVALLLVAALFWGLRGVVGILIVFGLALAGAAFVMTRGIVEPWQADLWDPRVPLVWIRYGLVSSLLGGGLAAAYAHLIADLEQRALGLEQALIRERSERRQREAAFAALERAKRVEALAHLAGGMTHDFNNSLQIMMGTAQLIRRAEGASADVVRLAESLLESAENSAASIRALLCLGRKDASPPQIVSVQSIVEKVEVPLRRALPKKISLELQVTTDARVRLEPSRLVQALLNLALNARDAMPDGGQIRFSVVGRELLDPPTDSLARPGRFVTIACTDTGHGMTPEVQSRLFEPFFTTKAPGQGTGLGLLMVRAFVQECGGFVEVESEVGAGTVFRLNLPVCST